VATNLATEKLATKPAVKPDWSMIQVLYERGEVSGRALARQYCLSHTAIQKRARSESWTRPVQSEPQQPRPLSRAKTAPAIDTAKLGAPEVRVSPTLAAATDPKAIIDMGRDLAARLLDELHATTAYRGEIEALIIAETAGDPDGRRRQAMLQVVGLPTRATVLKNLALAAKTLAEVMPGKRVKAEEAARTAGDGTEWGDDLAGPDALLN
jgi:hypothetical protein